MERESSPSTCVYAYGALAPTATPTLSAPEYEIVCGDALGLLVA